jgi:hypothetical protein
MGTSRRHFSSFVPAHRLLLIVSCSSSHRNPRRRPGGSMRSEEVAKIPVAGGADLCMPQMTVATGTGHRVRFGYALVEMKRINVDRPSRTPSIGSITRMGAVVAVLLALATLGCGLGKCPLKPTCQDGKTYVSCSEDHGSCEYCHTTVCSVGRCIEDSNQDAYCTVSPEPSAGCDPSSPDLTTRCGSGPERYQCVKGYRLTEESALLGRCPSDFHCVQYESQTACIPNDAVRLEACAPQDPYQTVCQSNNLAICELGYLVATSPCRSCASFCVGGIGGTCAKDADCADGLRCTPMGAGVDQCERP